MLRKLTLYVLFPLLGLLMLAGARYAQPMLRAAYGVISPAPTPVEVGKGTLALAALGDTTALREVATVNAYNATQSNATGAEIAAGQQASGWVPSATVGSKFITFAGALILAVLLIWRLQNLTHPEPSRWAKEDYTADFKGLTPAEKFEVYGRIRLQYVLLAAAALVFAALVV